MAFLVDDTRETLHKPAPRPFWRSLGELEQTPEFLERLHREFPVAASEWLEDVEPGAAKNPGLSRRNFLTLMGAGLSLMGLTGCTTRKPDAKIVPYVIQPEQIVPGKPIFYASALNVNGAAHGVIVETHEGRPTKIEGNPNHPASLGATNIWMQAAVLGLYDPDRSQVVAQLGGSSVSTWDKFQSAIAPMLAAKLQNGGSGMRVLSEPIVSPTLAAQAQALKRRFPNLKWHVFSPTDRGNVREGAKQTFGQPRNVVYAFDKADVVVALDSDFLIDEPGSLRYSRQFVDRRRVRKDRPEMNRLYVVESARTITGAMADHRVPTTPDAIERIANAIASGVRGGMRNTLDETTEKFVRALVDDLKQAGKFALVIAGEYQPPQVHRLCHEINAALGAVGNTVLYTDPIDAGSVDANASLAELVHDMNAGSVDLLVMLGGNPVYNAPADLDFASAMGKVATNVHLGLYEDETSFLSQWHLPQTHPLEEWSDLRAFDGTVSIVQPMIAPLYEGRSVHEVLAILLGDAARSGHEIVRGHWAEQHKDNFDFWWDKSLHDGLIEDSALPPRESNRTQAANTTAPSSQPAPAGFRITFRPDPSIGDGAWANNAWLQELPKPISKLTWDNAAYVSRATAQKLEVEEGGTIRVKYAGRELAGVPVIVVPGQPADVITLHLGYGRTRAGKIGTKLGFNAYALRTSDAPWFGAGATVTRDDADYELAVTQEHQLMHGREIVRPVSIAELRARYASAETTRAEGANVEHPKTVPLTLYNPDEWENKGNKWGMVIDQTACTGCNACVVACYAENNVPTVGKEQVIRNREMAWLRIDTYFSAADAEETEPAANPETYFQPMLCQHCETAPCELVCPVGATTHSAEGLNEMTYNRCVGTRYCSNNCPYKVRRFNYLEYNGEVSQTQAMQKNPDVTVRQRGVMEKCSYCVQRINLARIDAKKQGREHGLVREGEVLTACQQSCPTQAIVFGNLNDPQSQVKKLKEEPTNYGLLTELNTEPRTTYLERVRNPNPAMKS